jgi:hypothetical protein
VTHPFASCINAVHVKEEALSCQTRDSKSLIRVTSSFRNSAVRISPDCFIGRGSFCCLVKSTIALVAISGVAIPSIAPLARNPRLFMG